MIKNLEGYGTWRANGIAFHEDDIHIAGGNFRSHGPSTVRLQANRDFDDAALFEYGEAVTITFTPDGEAAEPETFFVGRCISVPKYGSDSEEGHVYEIADAWHDMERIIYHEPWGYAISGEEVDTFALEEDDAKRMVPRFVFGLDELGDPIQIGDIIRRVVEYAAAQDGVSLQVGSIPTGEYPFYAECTNMSCAEIIRMALRLHPDWIPWIDHKAEAGPTLNITPFASMGEVSLPVGGDTLADTQAVTSFQITERLDLIPESVRICYEWADELKNPDVEDPLVDASEIYRKIHIDKYPEEGPDAGTNCMSVLIPLGGLSEQRQKGRLWCRTIPTIPSTATADPDEEEMIKEWFKAKYPHMANVDIADFEVFGFSREMIMEWEGLPEDPKPAKDPPPPINPKAVRLSPENDPDKYPRELYKGQVEDWMRVKVGRMLIKDVDIRPAPTANADTLKAIARGFPDFTITATNARTKRYAGPSQWTPGDAIPTGVAQAVYESIVNSCRLQGTVTIEHDDVPMTQYMGKKITLGGSGYTGQALVNAVSWDAEEGTITLDVGPSPYLAPVDFLELQRMMRQLPIQWWTKEERDNTRAKYGAESGASAAGDSVGAFDHPETVFAPPPKPVIPLHIIDVKPAYIPVATPAPAEGYKRFWIEWGVLNDKIATNWDDHYDLNATTHFFAKATLGTGPLSVTSWEIVTGASSTAEATPAWPIGGSRPTEAVYYLGVALKSGDTWAIMNTGGGSLLLTEHITDVQPSETYGGVELGRMLAFYRQPY